MVAFCRKKTPDPRERNQQFRYIRKELIGLFCHAGRKWSQEPIKVLDHDFPSDSNGVAILYDIYDLARNEGFVCVGTSRDTSEFAVDSICKWWQKSGSYHYPTADRSLVLADCGGSNGYRTRLWKHQLQVVFCDRFGLQVKVCHYPPSSSKWNPIEHRMFSFISSNWAAEPLLDHETVLKFIRTTKTSTGLKIRALRINKHYKIGRRVSDQQMQQIILKRYTKRPNWNYSISPSNM
ncbi:MAG: ISAzo13 family transposase [Deltaproteobacteria bacterium]|nr:ISAzo13 family transposase [Deltaproteobacteria bacterium]